MARVLEVTEERARLGCDSIASTCSACKGGCLLRRLAPGGTANLEVPRLDAHGVALETGARVTVEVGGRDLLGAALRAALLPLAGTLSGPLLLRAFAAEPAASDVVAVFAAALGLSAGWTAARIWLRHSPPHVAVVRERVSGPGGERQNAS